METLKAQIYPLVVSFVSGFLSTLAASITVVGQADWNTSLILAIIISAVTGGINAAFAKKVPTTLGGRKG